MQRSKCHLDKIEYAARLNTKARLEMFYFTKRPSLSRFNISYTWKNFIIFAQKVHFGKPFFTSDAAANGLYCKSFTIVNLQL